jgi:hypothetical protein
LTDTHGIFDPSGASCFEKLSTGLGGDGVGLGGGILYITDGLQERNVLRRL